MSKLTEKYWLSGTRLSVAFQANFYHLPTALRLLDKMKADRAYAGVVLYERVRPDPTGYNPQCYRVIERQTPEAKAWFEFIG
jgi:hypothetical protein